MFAATVCVVCAVVVSSAAVSLKDLQTTNAALDKQKNVLIAAGLASEGASLSPEQIAELFKTVHASVIDLETGKVVDDVDPNLYDQRKATTDPSRSRLAPDNRAQLQRLPNLALVYQVRNEASEVTMHILPIEGKGLWSTLYGFIAIGSDLDTVRGLTFYDHKETPGLGGEVDNPKWKALWPGRSIFGEDGQVRLAVVKGRAGSVEEDPYSVDGLSGATITSRGVSYLIDFWLGEHGFGTYLERIRQQPDTTAAERPDPLVLGATPQDGEVS